MIELPTHGRRVSIWYLLPFALLISATNFAHTQGTTITPATTRDKVVYVDLKGNTSTRAGHIVDYSGKGLVLKIADGRKLKVDPPRVKSISTDFPSDFAEAEKHFAQGEFQEAVKKYQSAIRSEQRRWAKKMIFAKTIPCLRNMKQSEAACDRFFALVSDDPDTPFFSSIPLAWLTTEPPASLERKCAAWLKDNRSSVRLLAASYLISTSQRSSAMTVLQEIADSRQSPQNMLASSQIWRTQTVGASEDRLHKWEAAIRQLEPELQFGPFFVLGKGWNARQDWENASLAFLQAAIPTHPDQPLTIEALWLAAKSLEKQGEPNEAQRIYRELTVRFPTATLSNMARQKLSELKSNSSRP